MRLNFFQSGKEPMRFGTKIAFVFLLMELIIFSSSIQSVSNLTSIKLGTNPNLIIELTVFCQIILRDCFLSSVHITSISMYNLFVNKDTTFMTANKTCKQHQDE